jgi:hypothetical protein
MTQSARESNAVRELAQRVDAFDKYLAWAKQQQCCKCGAKASERPRGEDGHLIGWWLTEIDCGCAGEAAVNARDKLIDDGLSQVW